MLLNATTSPGRKQTKDIGNYANASAMIENMFARMATMVTGETDATDERTSGSGSRVLLNEETSLGRKQMKNTENCANASAKIVKMVASTTGIVTTGMFGTEGKGATTTTMKSALPFDGEA